VAVDADPDANPKPINTNLNLNLTLGTFQEEKLSSCHVTCALLGPFF